MLSALAEGLASLDGQALLLMAVGVILCQIVVVIPGLGGTFVLVILLPFTYSLEPTAAIALLVGAAVVSGTGNTVTSVLFGVPGSPIGVATTFDGYPMAQRGEAGRAIAAGLTASALGGVLGAVILAMLIPVVRPIVLAFGPAEFFMLVLTALVFMAYVGQGDMLKALIAGGLGLMLSFVGQEPSTGTLRYTYGSLYLWQGVHLVPFMIGLFAFAEMAVLTKKGGTIVDPEKALSGSAKSGRTTGILDAFRHWRATVQSSLAGILVGIVPGLGGETSQFIAYAQVAKYSPNRERFGTGEVEGVIAADAATNSKDGGALVPTLAFGIPGSSTMAILLAALISFGIQPGPGMLDENLSIFWMIVWLLLFANILGAALVLAVSDQLAKLTFVDVNILVPIITLASLLGAYATNRHIGDVWVALAAGVVGYFMKTHGYSRATFTIGFVLGRILERNFLLAMQLYGWRFLTRPISLVLALGLLAVLLAPLAKALGRSRGRDEVPRSDPEGVE